MQLDLPPALLLLLLIGSSLGCLKDPAEAYRWTGTVCRLTYPAAVVLNEKTTKVIEAAFQHATYPSVKAEKSLSFMGKLSYGLDNLEIHNLTIGGSRFELRPGEGIAMEISNVSAVFRGTLQYGYGSWLVNVDHTITFEIESQIDLGINPKLYCGGGKVAADTSDCYLNFDKLRLHLQGDKEPNWMKKLFTDFITFTVKLAVKGQICKEINKVANILADFIQDTAEQFLSDGGISVDIGVTTAPVITSTYIESYHKGLTSYNGTTAIISDSVFQPSQLTEHRMLYFWISDQVLNALLSAAHHDRRFQLNVSSGELTELFKRSALTTMPELFRKCLLESDSPRLRVWSSSLPLLNSSTQGTNIQVTASGQLWCGSEDTPTFSFQTAITTDVAASYADKRLSLQGRPSEISVLRVEMAPPHTPDAAVEEFLKEAVEKIGVPKVLAVLEVELTRLLDKQGVNLFTIVDPEVLPQDGFVLIQMDFGFPHHLLVEFLKKTLQ